MDESQAAGAADAGGGHCGDEPAGAGFGRPVACGEWAGPAVGGGLHLRPHVDRFPQAEAEMALFDFIEGCYNPWRRHSGLGRLSPVNYERRHHAAA